MINTKLNKSKSPKELYVKVMNLYEGPVLLVRFGFNRMAGKRAPNFFNGLLH